MNKPWIIGVFAGALSVAIILIGASGVPALAPLVFVSPLPLMVVGLGWGWSTAVVGAAAGIAMIGLVTGMAGAAFFAVNTALGSVLLTRQALAGVGSSRGDTPSGEVLIWTVATAGAMFIAASVWFLQFDGGLQSFLTDAVPDLYPRLDQWLLLMQENGAEITRTELIAQIVGLMPVMAGLIWVVFMLANLMGAQALVTRMGLQKRGRFEIATLEVPKGLGLIVAVLLTASFVPGKLGFYAGTLGVFFALPFYLTGLLTVHVLSLELVNRNGKKAASYRGLRIAFLFLFYITHLVLTLLPVLVCTLGLVDQWRGFRRNALGMTSRLGE